MGLYLVFSQVDFSYPVMGGQTVKNKQILDLKKMAELKKNPLIRDRFLEEADKINDKVRNEMYHVSV